MDFFQVLTGAQIPAGWLGRPSAPNSTSGISESTSGLPLSSSPIEGLKNQFGESIEPSFESLLESAKAAIAKGKQPSVDNQVVESAPTQLVNVEREIPESQPQQIDILQKTQTDSAQHLTDKIVNVDVANKLATQQTRPSRHPIPTIQTDIDHGNNVVGASKFPKNQGTETPVGEESTGQSKPIQIPLAPHQNADSSSTISLPVNFDSPANFYTPQTPESSPAKIKSSPAATDVRVSQPSNVAQQNVESTAGQNIVLPAGFGAGNETTDSSRGDHKIVVPQNTRTQAPETISQPILTRSETPVKTPAAVTDRPVVQQPVPTVAENVDLALPKPVEQNTLPVVGETTNKIVETKKAIVSNSPSSPSVQSVQNSDNSVSVTAETSNTQPRPLSAPATDKVQIAATADAAPAVTATTVTAPNNIDPGQANSRAVLRNNVPAVEQNVASSDLRIQIPTSDVTTPQIDRVPVGPLSVPQTTSQNPPVIANANFEIRQSVETGPGTNSAAPSANLVRPESDRSQPTPQVPTPQVQIQQAPTQQVPTQPTTQSRGENHQVLPQAARADSALPSSDGQPLPQQINSPPEPAKDIQTRPLEQQYGLEKSRNGNVPTTSPTVPEKFVTPVADTNEQPFVPGDIQQAAVDRPRRSVTQIDAENKYSSNFSKYAESSNQIEGYASTSIELDHTIQKVPREPGQEFSIHSASRGPEIIEGNEVNIATHQTERPVANQAATVNRTTEFDFGFHKTLDESVREILVHRQDSDTKSDMTQIKLQINPPEFGPIEINISHKSGTSTASIVVANDQVLNQLQTNLQSLELTLESLNVDLQDIATMDKDSKHDSRHDHHADELPDETGNARSENTETSKPNSENLEPQSVNIQVGQAAVIDLVV